MADKVTGLTGTKPPPLSIPPLGTVLITGGCGFLGSHIVTLFLSKTSSTPGTSIHVLDLRAPTNPQAKVTYHTGDIGSSSSVRSLLETIKPDVVVHTASPIPDNNGGQKAKDFMWKINVEGTRTLLDESKRLGVKAFVYTSSASVVGGTRSDLINADERWSVIRGKLQPEYYSNTKAEAELLALSYNTREPEPFLTTALRPSAMFGEMDVQMIPNMLQVVRDGRTNFQLGTNENLFDFTYVGNVAQAHLHAAVKLVELHKKLTTRTTRASGSADDDGRPSADGEAFIITNQSPVYFWDFARAVWNAYYIASPSSSPKPPATLKQVYTLPRDLMLFVSIIAVFIMKILRRPPPKLDPVRVRYSCMTRYFNPRKTEALLDYTPEFTLDEGIERTIKWFVEREAEGASKEAKKDK